MKQESPVVSCLSIAIFTAGLWIAPANIEHSASSPIVGEDTPRYDHEGYNYSTTASVGEESLAMERVAIIHHVVSDLIENSEDLDHSIVQMVDKEFWNLI